MSSAAVLQARHGVARPAAAEPPPLTCEARRRDRSNGDRLHARELADDPQVPDRDDGRRRGAARLRQRRLARRVLHQRRARCPIRWPRRGRSSPTRFANRLYRNNHDGTFARRDAQPPAWTDRHRRIRDGRRGGRLRQRRRRGPLRDGLRREHPVPQRWQRPLRARHRRGRGRGRRMERVAAFFDYDNDGWLDLFVTPIRRLEFAPRRLLRRAPARLPRVLPSEHVPGDDQILYRNNHDGTFADVSQATGIARGQGTALGVAVADYDGEAGRTSTWRTTRCRVSCSATTAGRRSPRPEWQPASPSTATAGRRRHGRGLRRLRQRRTSRPLRHRSVERDIRALSQHGEGLFSFVTVPRASPTPRAICRVGHALGGSATTTAGRTCSSRRATCSTPSS